MAYTLGSYTVVILLTFFLTVDCQFNSTNVTLNDTESFEYEITLPTETTEEMEINSTEPSSLNTTEYITEDITTSTSSPEHQQSSYKSNFHCSCDLLVDHCDINCCCDVECAEEDIKTFTNCGFFVESSSEQYCLSKNFIFANNTPYVMTKMSNNLFCIYKDNNKEMYFYKEIQPITDLKLFGNLLNENQKYSWQNDKSRLPVPTNKGKKVGTPIEIIFDSGRSGYLSTVKRFMNGLCSVENPMAYMIDSDTDCHHEIDNLQSDCTQNKWLNGHTATVEIILADIERQQFPVKWAQKNSVQFIKWTETDSNDTQEVLKTFKISGNPGYLVGHPVLAGNSVTATDDTEDETLAIDLNVDPKKWLTIIDPRQYIHCNDATRLSNRLQVTFKDDITTGCVLIISLTNITGNACVTLQALILDYLLGWNPPDAIGTFGNSSPHKRDQWISILHENKPPPSHLVNDFVCTNIVRALKIVVLFANTGSFYFYQSKIVATKFQYDLMELNLDCKDVQCDSRSGVNLNFHIQTSVEFVDVSEKAIAIFAQPPPIHFELPADFFYPFASSSALKLKFPIVLLLAHLILAIKSLCKSWYPYRKVTLTLI
ncbi:Tectonic-1 [Chamberlinius hualienensis]